jgi:formamidopyrimidine-DNA glycosylase
VLKNVADNGGRETERDLFGKAGEYTTKIGRTTYGEPSALDEAEGLRERIIWGKIFFCPKCQRI